MARIKQEKQIPPARIDKFLGLNENSDGELNLKLGEATKMFNFRVTSGLQLKKREGWKVLFSGLTGNVQGSWYGKINDISYFLFVNNCRLYKGNLTDGTKTELWHFTSAPVEWDAPTRFLQFGTKVYMNNGGEYLSFDGNTVQNVIGYRPKTYISAVPGGGVGGSPFEQINVLNGLRHKTFNADGTSTAYIMDEKSNTSIDFVKVNGVLKTLGVDYTVNATFDTVTFSIAPAIGEDNVDIGWTHGTGQRDLIEKCRFSMDYSGKTDSRVFLWGNADYKNRRFWSGLADGVPSAEYFEANSWKDEGNGQYAITDLIKTDDVQKIFMENGARYSNYDTVTVQSQTIADFPSFEMSDEIGNEAYGQVQTINGTPFSLYKGVYSWSNTIVLNKTKHDLISQKVQDSLDGIDLSQVITYNWQEQKEYWLCLPSSGIVWIYNYLNGTWYKFNNVFATNFIVINGEMYFGTNGTINKFDKSLRADNFLAIIAVWQMGFYDFGAEYLTKFMNYITVSINPSTKTSIDAQVVTNNQGTSIKQSVYYSLLTYLHTNFAHYSFSTSYNPQPKHLNTQANGFVYLKLIITNDSLTDVVTVLSINLPIRLGGRV